MDKGDSFTLWLGEKADFDNNSIQKNRIAYDLMLLMPSKIYSNALENPMKYETFLLHLNGMQVNSIRAVMAVASKLKV